MGKARRSGLTRRCVVAISAAASIGDGSAATGGCDISVLPPFVRDPGLPSRFAAGADLASMLLGVLPAVLLDGKDTTVKPHFAHAWRAAAGVVLTAGVLLAGCGSDGTDGSAGASPSRDHLNEGELLNLDESLTSPDGSTELRLGGAGLKLYLNGQVIWSSDPVKFPSSAYFTPDMSFFVEG
ncbi:MAG: hypothetical protein SF182_30110, partial [Deltaproteobacteria bacterium]|nr:hypothetical protein [Deltaproteobacteria bacterium]